MQEQQLNPFAPAVMTDSYLRMAINGPEGSGKTYTSILLATLMLGGSSSPAGSHLARRENGLAWIAFIDSERGSARKYSPIFTSNIENQGAFDVLELERNAQGAINPETYITAIEAARQFGYEILIIDSLSHAWDGILHKKDLLDKKTYNVKGANSFTNWREITPLHNRLVDAILDYPGHVFTAMRVKTETIIEHIDGKTKVRKLGLKSVQREGVGYEFDIIFEMTHATATISKSRCKPLAELEVIDKPGQEVADILLDWLNVGIEAAMSRSAFIEAMFELGQFADEGSIGKFLKDHDLLNISGTYKYEAMLEQAQAILSPEDSDAQSLAEEILA